MSEKRTAKLCLHGDTLEVRWTGSVWVSPCNGQQHARLTDAMRAEVVRYLTDCGEDADEMEDKIEAYLSAIAD